MQAELRAEEEKDFALDMKAQNFRTQHQHKQSRLVFYSWTLLAADRITRHTTAYSLLEKVELRRQASLSIKS